ncbi:abortive infection family protein [Methanobrevibacter curvatus]|uniref:Abortive infection protein-like C-terminal domain-containing protein n=1 Tax=Methanobrevibacter curvatus TaxID=49547 RepID=A0A165Z5Y6_9EURY|nr:abortive infection family protein [Methanobrevibacter curvatus]KZX10288.1 hypothetical protein MBCUR_18550 [Methanobrevibacter curvatus]
MEELFIKIDDFQSLLIGIATGDSDSYNDDEGYEKLRKEILSFSEINELLPYFVKNKRSPKQFWDFIKPKYPSYAERRNFINESFEKVLEYAESLPYTRKKDFDDGIRTKIDKFDEYIVSEWDKALERKNTDPDGAITMSRTLVETTCKFILDNLGEEHKSSHDLPKLYKLTANKLNLSPTQHSEQILKQILGGCTSIVVGVGALRNELGDSHGKSTSQPKPSSIYAELAVNLAGTMTTFLLESYESIL